MNCRCRIQRDPTAIPDPIQVMKHPELAALAVLAAAVDAAEVAILASWPELWADDVRYEIGGRPARDLVRKAERITTSTQALRKSLDRYRAAIDREWSQPRLPYNLRGIPF